MARNKNSKTIRTQWMIVRNRMLRVQIEQKKEKDKTDLKIFAAVEILVTSTTTNIIQIGLYNPETKETLQVFIKHPFIDKLSYKQIPKAKDNDGCLNETISSAAQVFKFLCKPARKHKVSLVFYSNVECQAFVLFFSQFSYFKMLVQGVLVYQKYLESTGAWFRPLHKRLNLNKPAKTTDILATQLAQLFSQTNMNSQFQNIFGKNNEPEAENAGGAGNIQISTQVQNGQNEEPVVQPNQENASSKFQIEDPTVKPNHDSTETAFSKPFVINHIDEHRPEPNHEGAVFQQDASEVHNYDNMIQECKFNLDDIPLPMDDHGCYETFSLDLEEIPLPETESENQLIINDFKELENVSKHTNKTEDQSTDVTSPEDVEHNNQNLDQKTSPAFKPLGKLIESISLQSLERLKVMNNIAIEEDYFVLLSPIRTFSHKPFWRHVSMTTYVANSEKYWAHKKRERKVAKQKLKRKARQIERDKKLVGKVSKTQKMPTPSQKKVGLSLATLDDLASKKQIFSDNTEQDLIISFQDNPQILEIPTQDKPQIPEISTRDNPQIPEKKVSAKEIDCTKKKISAKERKAAKKQNDAKNKNGAKNKNSFKNKNGCKNKNSPKKKSQKTKKKKAGKEKLCSHKSCRPLKNTGCFFSAPLLPPPLFPHPPFTPPHFPDRFHGEKSFPNNFHGNNSFPNNFHGKLFFPNNVQQNKTFPNNFYGNNTVPDNFHGNNTFPHNFNGRNTFPNNFFGNDTSTNNFQENNTVPQSFHKNNTFHDYSVPSGFPCNPLDANSSNNSISGNPEYQFHQGSRENEIDPNLKEGIENHGDNRSERKSLENPLNPKENIEQSTPRENVESMTKVQEQSMRINLIKERIEKMKHMSLEERLHFGKKWKQSTIGGGMEPEWINSFQNGDNGVESRFLGRETSEWNANPFQEGLEWNRNVPLIDEFSGENSDKPLRQEMSEPLREKWRVLKKRIGMELALISSEDVDLNRGDQEEPVKVGRRNRNRISKQDKRNLIEEKRKEFLREVRLDGQEISNENKRKQRSKESDSKRGFDMGPRLDDVEFRERFEKYLRRSNETVSSRSYEFGNESRQGVDIDLRERLEMQSMRRSDTESNRKFDSETKRGSDIGSSREFRWESRRSSDRKSRRRIGWESRKSSDRESSRRFGWESRKSSDRESRRRFECDSRRSSERELSRGFGRGSRRLSERELSRGFGRGSRRSSERELSRGFGRGSRRSSERELSRSSERELSRGFGRGSRRLSDREPRQGSQIESKLGFGTESRLGFDIDLRARLDTKSRSGSERESSRGFGKESKRGFDAELSMSSGFDMEPNSGLGRGSRRGFNIESIRGFDIEARSGSDIELRRGFEHNPRPDVDISPWSGFESQRFCGGLTSGVEEMNPFTNRRMSSFSVDREHDRDNYLDTGRGFAPGQVWDFPGPRGQQHSFPDEVRFNNYCQDPWERY